MTSREYKQKYGIKKRKIKDDKDKLNKKNKKGKETDDDETTTSTVTSNNIPTTDTVISTASSPCLHNILATTIPIPTRDCDVKANSNNGNNDNNSNDESDKSKSDNNNNKNNSNPNSVILNPSPTIPSLTVATVSSTTTSNPDGKSNKFNPSSGPVMAGMIIAIIIALVTVAFIIKTVYYFGQTRHQQLLDNASWLNYNTYDTNNIEVTDNGSGIGGGDSGNGAGSDNISGNSLMIAINRPQRTMSGRFSNKDDIISVNSRLYENDYNNSISTKQQEYVSDDDNSSLDMSVDIPPKIVNWEECMR